MSRGQRIISLAKSAGTCGWLLLGLPVLYLFITRKRDLDMYATVDASAFISIIYMSLCFLAVLVENQKHYSNLSRKTLFRTPIVWFLMYTLYGFVSMFWSVNVQLTGYRAFECFTMMLLMLQVWQRLFAKCDLARVLDWCLLYVAIALICNIVSKLRYTSSLMGLLGSSQFLTTTFFFMALYHPHKRWIHYLIMVMAILSGSTVGYVGMAIGIVSLFWGKSKYKIPVFFMAVAFSLFLVDYGPQRFVKDTIFYDKSEISIEETSGRDKIMETAMISLNQNPMGYGFFAGEPYILYQHYRGAINGHNSFFSAAMGLGYVGIVLLFIFFLGMFRVTFYRGIPREYRQPLIGCFFVGFLHCMGNPGIGSRVYGSWTPVMLLFTLICSFYAYNKNKRHAHNMGNKELPRL